MSKDEENDLYLFCHESSTQYSQYLDRFVDTEAQLEPIRPFLFR
jgi:hypothetical protein